MIIPAIRYIFKIVSGIHAFYIFLFYVYESGAQIKMACKPFKISLLLSFLLHYLLFIDGMFLSFYIVLIVIDAIGLSMSRHNCANYY